MTLHPRSFRTYGQYARSSYMKISVGKTSTWFHFSLLLNLEKYRHFYILFVRFFSFKPAVKVFERRGFVPRSSFIHVQSTTSKSFNEAFHPVLEDAITLNEILKSLYPALVKQHGFPSRKYKKTGQTARTVYHSVTRTPLQWTFTYGGKGRGW